MYFVYLFLHFVFGYRYVRRKDREKMLKKQEKPYAKITQMNA